MGWYWIVLISVWAAGFPGGIMFLSKNPDSLYHHPIAIMPVVDVFMWLIVFLIQILLWMALGWLFLIYYGVIALRKRRRQLT